MKKKNEREKHVKYHTTTPDTRVLIFFSDGFRNDISDEKKSYNVLSKAHIIAFNKSISDFEIMSI